MNDEDPKDLSTKGNLNEQNGADCDNSKGTFVNSSCHVSEANNELPNESPISVEGHRMLQLRKALERTVDKCVSAGKLSLFARYMPEMFDKRHKALKAIQEQYTLRLRENIQSEIETMFQEENMAELMGELDQIIQQTPASNDQSWRPNHCVEENIRPHLICVKLKHKAKLQEDLRDIEVENRQLQELIMRKRQKLQLAITKCQEKTDNLVQVTEDL